MEETAKERALGLTKEATLQEIKQAYRKAALLTHPDRKGGSEKKFLEVYEAYERLSSKSVSGGITKEAYETFKNSYTGSEEEREELLALYKKCRGNMFKVLDLMIISSDEDEPRFREIIDGLLREGAVPPYPAYRRRVLADKRRQEKRKREAVEAEELARKMGMAGESIETRIGERAEKWNRFLAELEDKSRGKLR
jgi:DnaJ homolog subfamily C member 9